MRLTNLGGYEAHPPQPPVGSLAGLARGFEAM
jgi:hypothetical protein